MAGGTASRLGPVTQCVSKHLLPVFDKPMIYFPLSTLMLGGIREIMIVVNEIDLPAYEKLLGDGSHLGIKLIYALQSGANGIAEGVQLAQDFASKHGLVLALGDNVFFGNNLVSSISEGLQKNCGATIFLQKVADPSGYGVALFDEDGKLSSLIEKPKDLKMGQAITGLYIFDASVFEKSKELKPSSRGELEITDLLSFYLDESSLEAIELGRACFWFDAGTPQNLVEASYLIRQAQQRLNCQVGSVDLIAAESGWISERQLEKNLEKYTHSDYAKSVRDILFHG